MTGLWRKARLIIHPVNIQQHSLQSIYISFRVALCTLPRFEASTAVLQARTWDALCFRLWVTSFVAFFFFFFKVTHHQLLANRKVTKVWQPKVCNIFLFKFFFLVLSCDQFVQRIIRKRRVNGCFATRCGQRVAFGLPEWRGQWRAPQCPY